ncbi:hypothetical protein [Sporolactobacillus inulinus]|uniref:Fe3+ hydroxamate ABC transporter substrate-binding protein n=1 Tax=Sporolactobacillus inulinus CASD TaxID=1069536 RepID=A0A0U1QN76_9BACL|nr:hypothetical protein [Sporolactobacillus inulinus]KLI02263.1 hypothetical protein SINU_08980 [Sporolactobacillus inulinus CASD]GEB77395.1 hypothetical protein SIN01_17400 [Sporolactobacillus inulinus]
MGFFSRLKQNYVFKCSECGKTIEPGEFMCVMAKSPEKAWYGVTETVIHRFVTDTGGKIYCKACFERNYGE